MGKPTLATIGDAVLRLSTSAAVPLSSAASLDLDVSGSEANVACHLSRLGHGTRWMGCLPNTPLGRRATLPLREAGVDISLTKWRDSGRVSAYYVEPAHPPRDASVIYDRRDSCFEGLAAGEVDWDALLDAYSFHATGITAALSGSMLELVAAGLKKAKEKGLRTSLDVNHRDLLWSPDEAREGLSGLFPDVDLLLCSARDAKKVFGIDGDPGEVAARLAETAGAGLVVVSDGDRNVTGIEKGKLFHAAAFDTFIEDRVGAGDALAAGVIHGLSKRDFGHGLRCGSALAAYVLSVRGEQPDFCEAGLERMVAGHTGDISR